MNQVFILCCTLPRRDNPDYRDLFVREASIVGGTRDTRFFMSDLCKFDIIRSELLYVDCRLTMLHCFF